MSKHPFDECAEVIEDMLRENAALVRNRNYHGTAILPYETVKRLRAEAVELRYLARLDREATA